MKKTTYFTLIVTLIFSIVTSCVSEDATPVRIPPIEGSVLTLNEKADPTEANQFWIDLSSGNMKQTHRELWDLGFYCGDEFRLMLNSSLVMSVGKIENVTDINAVNSETVKDLQDLVQAANFTDNAHYVDNPNGDIVNQTTGIAPISADDSQNNVYLLNMGYKTYAGTTSPGTIYNIGESRGWKKIRILRHSLGYKIQYANLDDSSYNEFIISKDSEYNYRFFSFTTGSYADIQPKKKEWDLCYTVFTNLTINPSNNLDTSYIYPDIVLHNILGGASVYEVSIAAGQGESAYNNFKKEDVDGSKFISNDQRTIGSNWRTTTGTNGAEVYSNKFYVLKDSDGFYFKIRFLRMKDDQNNRGFPQFEYKPL